MQGQVFRRKNVVRLTRTKKKKFPSYFSLASFTLIHDTVRSFHGNSSFDNLLEKTTDDSGQNLLTFASFKLLLLNYHHHHITWQKVKLL